MVKIAKIPLEDFINILIDIYEKGADFVDLLGKTDENDEGIDILRIEVKREYLRDGSLTDDDIQDLESFI